MGQQMQNGRRSGRVAAAILAWTAWCGVAAIGQAAQPAQGPKIVALTADGCARIEAGDIVTFTWNPGFDHPEAVTGLRNFALGFVGPDGDPAAMQDRPAIWMALMPRRRLVPPLQSSVTPAGNGYYDMRFEAYLPHIRSGVYHLALARAVAQTASDYQGPIPQMTNSPLSLPLCLDVIQGSLTGRRPDAQSTVSPFSAPGSTVTPASP